MTRTNRLLLDDHVVSLPLDEAEPDLMVLFRPDMALGEGCYRAPGRVILDRLEAMGTKVPEAYACLAEALDLAESAYAGAVDAEPGSEPSWMARGRLEMAGLDPTGWSLRLGTASDPNEIEWLLGLVTECPTHLVLRLYLGARPDTLVTLETTEPIRTLDTSAQHLIVAQNRDDADLLSHRLSQVAPHLDDLVRCAHLGGDGDPGHLSVQVQALAHLALHQSVAAVFHNDAESRLAGLLLPPLPANFHVIHVENDPAFDPQTSLDRIFAALGLPAFRQVG